jgi:uncharacterized protein (TIGR02145 family)
MVIVFFIIGRIRLNGHDVQKTTSQSVTQSSVKINNDNSISTKPISKMEDENAVHDYIDLDLPSGTKWAKCNIGAIKPESYGQYFAWGETMAKTNYSWSTYKYCNGSQESLTKYCDGSGYGLNGFTDQLKILQASDDAATANWGADWRTPTKSEWEELYENTTNKWSTLNGVTGRLFMAKNGQSLFLPAAGNCNNDKLDRTGPRGLYWSSSYRYDIQAWYFHFDSGNYYLNGSYRYYGFTVRPVRTN